MAARIITTLIMSGSQILFKAFGEAYRKGVQNATGGANATTTRTAAAVNVNLEQARMILELPKGHTKEDLLKRYRYLSEQNDVARGGSEYIQAKVENAKKLLEAAAAAPAEGAGASGAAGGAAGGK
eukprot:c27609_g1_i1.p4 GENE.c27609_g1_i1~~c27609_g1_i1.p4  ORF type:complete len:126 (+),score=19.65 c27609_g1_i1:130-507(+)